MSLIGILADIFTVITSLLALVKEYITAYITRKRERQLLNLLYRMAGKENERENMIDFNRYVNHRLKDVTQDSEYNLKKLKKDLKPNSSENKIVFILGDPGSGKSTLMVHLAFWYCKYNRRINSGEKLADFGIEYHRMRDYKSIEELKKNLENDFEALFLDGFDEFVVLQHKSAEVILEELFGSFEKNKLNSIRKIYIASRKEPFKENVKEKLTRTNLNQYQPKIIEICPFDRKQILLLYRRKGAQGKRGKNLYKMRRYLLNNSAIFRIPLLIEYADIIMKEYCDNVSLSLWQALDAIVNDWLKREEQLWHSRQKIGQEKDKEKQSAYYKNAWGVILAMCQKMVLSGSYGLCIDDIEKIFEDYDDEGFGLKNREFFFSTRQLIRKVNDKDYEFIHMLFFEFFTARFLVALESVSFEQRKVMLSDSTKNYRSFYTHWIYELPADSFDIKQSKEESLMQKIRKSIKFNFANHECDIEKQIFELISAECISLFEMPEISVYGILWLFPLARKIEWKSYQLSLSEITNLMGEKSFIAITDGRLEKPSDLRCFFPFRNLDVKNNEFIDLEWIKDYESFDRLCLYGNYVETLEPLSHLEISKLEISIKSEKNLDELFTFSKSSCWIDFSGPLFLYRKLEQYQRSKQNWYLAFLPEIETFPMYYNNYPCGEGMGHVLKAVFHLAVVSFCTEKHFESKVFNLGKETGRYLYLCKKYEESLDVFRQLRYLIENTEDAEKHFLIKTEGWIGQILAKTGNYDDAIPLLRSVCGEKWKDDADNETLLMWYWRMVSMYRKNMNINVSEYGINDIIEVMFLWGKKLYENYEYEEAEEILRDCYQKRKEVLGENCDDTLTAWEWLGRTLNQEKKYKEAEAELKACYQMRRDAFGADDEETLSVQGLLGEIFYNNKKYKEAECELRGCWEKRKEVLGEEDKNTLNTQLWLGSTLYQEKKYEEAREILKDCYQKRKEGFGEDDDNTLTVQKWLGSTLYEEKKYEEAERILKDCYEKRKESFGENHVDTLKVQAWLGYTLYQEKKYEEAEGILKDCYEKRKGFSGGNHDYMLTVQEWLGYTLYREKKYEEAEGILKDCYQKRKEGFGEDYDDTLKVQAWLGYTLYQEKKYEEAEGILKDCYEKRKGLSGENHDYMLTVQEWLGRTLYQEKKYEEAEGTLKDCYEKRKESFGENHDDTLTVREWLERTLEALK